MIQSVTQCLKTFDYSVDSFELCMYIMYNYAVYCNGTVIYKA